MEFWAIVELFGHNKIAGKVSEETIAGQAFVRIDVPQIETIPAYTKYLHGNAIYAITPMDELAVRDYAAHIQERPMVLFNTKELIIRQLSPADYLSLRTKYEQANNQEAVALLDKMKPDEEEYPPVYPSYDDVD